MVHVLNRIPLSSALIRPQLAPASAALGCMLKALVYFSFFITAGQMVRRASGSTIVDFYIRPAPIVLAIVVIVAAPTLTPSLLALLTIVEFDQSSAAITGAAVTRYSRRPSPHCQLLSVRTRSGVVFHRDTEYR